MQENSLLGLGNLFRNAFRGTDRLTRMMPLWNGFNIGNFNAPQVIWETVNNNEYHLFSTTSEIYIPIMKKASMFSNGRFVVKDYKTNEPIENHPLIKLLEKPNPLMNRNEWLISVSVNHDIYGNVYIYKNQPSVLSEYPTTLVNLPNDDIAMKLSGVKYKQTELSEIIQKYFLQSNNEEFEPSEIIHIKNFSKNGIKGESILNSLEMPITNARGAHGFNNVNITKRGAIGVISPKVNPNGMTALVPNDRMEIEKDFKDENGIFDNQSAIRIVNKPIDYTQLSLGIKDQMIFETISLTMQRVIDAIGLNDNLFSKDKGATFNNANTYLKSAYQDCIIPFAEKFCFALNDSLGLTDKGIYVELDYSFLPCMQVDQKAEAETAQTKANAIQGLVSIGYSLTEAESLLGISSK
jgi:HK97 family phage portal protein